MQQKATPYVAFSTLYVLVVWSLIIGGSLWWNLDKHHKQTLQVVKATARANFNKDQAFRLWATRHGGVYVAPTEDTPPSPWMAHLPERDVVTTDGNPLTLLNPAYMLRQMMDEYSELYGIQGRITGIVYLNPNNKADSWEEDAIRQFEAGDVEKMSLDTRDGQSYMRLMRPMVMEPGCQKCHGHLGFANGQVRGGVGVSVPMAPFLELERKSNQTLQISHLGVWLLGMVSILVIARWRRDRSSEQQRYISEVQLAAKVFENAPHSTVITDPKGTIIRVNPAFTALTGYSSDEVIGQTPRVIKSDHHSSSFYEQMWRQLLEHGQWQGEVCNRRKDGSVFVVWQQIVAVRDAQGMTTNFIASANDITEKKEDENRIHHLAHYDVLTDLPNRQLFQDRLDQSLKQARRNHTQVALLFLDLD
ncbi:MAG: PAS domain S-box protein, partial [Halopseudomonas sp.]